MLLPFEDTFFNEEVGELAMRYLKRNPRVSSEKTLKCFKGIECLAVSDIATLLQVAGLHGGGSPQMETIAMMGRYDLEELKNISKYLFGIRNKYRRFERSETPVTPRKMLEKFRKVMQKKKDPNC